MITRPTGSDVLPFHRRPSHPGARKRAILAVRNARARREREAGPPDEAFTAERLSRDLASVPPDVALNGEEREHLRRMGWTDERLRRASAALREDLQKKVHTSVTAGGSSSRPVETASPGGRPTRASTPPAVAQLRSDRLGAMANIRAARRMGVDPTRQWPGQAGLPGKPRLGGASLAASIGSIPDPGKYGRPTGGASPASPGPGPRVEARPGRARTGGGARRVVPVTGADRPVPERPRRRSP